MKKIGGKCMKIRKEFFMCSRERLDYITEHPLPLPHRPAPPRSLGNTSFNEMKRAGVGCAAAVAGAECYNAVEFNS